MSTAVKNDTLFPHNIFSRKNTMKKVNLINNINRAAMN